VKCYIVKDLLPNYIDGLTGGETSAEMKKHLDDCADCRTAREKMTATKTNEVKPGDSNINFVKKLKAAILRRNAAAAFTACLVILIGLLAYGFLYQIPLPYDSYRMKAEIVKMGYTTLENGDRAWTFFDGDELGNADTAWDRLTLADYALSRVTRHVYGRDINRNGEMVRVVYYCYTKTPINSLLYDYDRAEDRVSGRMISTDIYGEAYDREDYKPKMIEVYYLPMSFNKIQNLSNEDFDAIRTNSIPVWKGEI